MEILKRFTIANVHGEVQRVSLAGRIVDFWDPREPTSHILVVHDGQNVFDPTTSTRAGETMEVAQAAIRVSNKLNIPPPIIVAIFHSASKSNPHGRTKDLVPARILIEGNVTTFDNRAIFPDPTPWLVPNELESVKYLNLVTDLILPKIALHCGADLSTLDAASLGASLGGLASMYFVAERPEIYSTAIALSPYWILGHEPFVRAMINFLPEPRNHRFWMSRGTEDVDAEYEPYQDLADQLMTQLGYVSEVNYVGKVFSGSGHDEIAWASYIDEPLEFWLSGSCLRNG